MFIIISGSNRKNSNSIKIASLVKKEIESHQEKASIIDLAKIPRDVFTPENYGNPSKDMLPHQEAILNATGIITVIPEYNGSFPGILKYFIDLLKFPESLRSIPCSFVGVAAGSFGSLRSVEQMQAVYQYRQAILFSKYVLFPQVDSKINEDGTEIVDAFTKKLFQEMLGEFIPFAKKLQS